MTMTIERFEHLADAYGADLDRWPQDCQAMARALYDANPQARDVLDQACELDGLLDAVPRPAASLALRHRVLDQGLEIVMASRRKRRVASWAWLSGAGWAAAACAGVAFGLSLTWEASRQQQADEVLYQASLAGAEDTEVLDG